MISAFLSAATFIVALWTIAGPDYEPDLRQARAVTKIDYQHQVSLFQEASLIEIDGPFAFVHSGIHLDRPIHEQERAHCLSIRKPFLEYPAHFSHVVHGHTITESHRPLVTHSRIALHWSVWDRTPATLIIDAAADSLEFAWIRQSDSEATVEFIEPVVTNIPERLHGYFITISTMQLAR